MNINTFNKLNEVAAALGNIIPEIYKEYPCFANALQLMREIIAERLNHEEKVLVYAKEFYSILDQQGLALLQED